MGYDKELWFDTPASGTIEIDFRNLIFRGCYTGKLSSTPSHCIILCLGFDPSMVQKQDGGERALKGYSVATGKDPTHFTSSCWTTVFDVA